MVTNKNTVDRRKAEILSAAEKVFGERGYSAATVEEIARRANISKGSIYNYFQNKQDIFAEIFLRELSDDDNSLGILIQQNIPAREKFQKFMETCYRRFTRYEALGRLVLEFWATAAGEGRDGPFARAFRALYERYHQRIVAMFRQGQEEGDFVLEYGPEISAWLLIAAVDGMHIQMLLGARPAWTETEFSAFQQAVSDALVAGKNRKGKKIPRQDVFT